MSDLIARQKAIEFLGEEPEVWCGDTAEYAVREQWRADVSAIKAVPPAEQEIIRCKDCKHWMREKLEGFELPYGDCESPDIWDCIRGNAHDVIAFRTNEDFHCGFAMTEDSEGEE